MTSRLSLAGIPLLLTALLLPVAEAVDLEKLVMPGRLIEGHADTESDCGACHDEQSDAASSALCTACHEDIGNDRSAQTGFHGLFPPSRENDCVACHTDHEGRDADIVDLRGGLFDHDFSDFTLTGAHEQVVCQSCHAPDESFSSTPSDCVDCHRDVDIHRGALGRNCDSCHTTVNWRESIFDHDTTGYTLTGGHADVACADCHVDNQFAATPRSCGSCHAVDDVHDGSKGARCGDCHTTASWGGIRFDHLRETGFALTDGHAGLSCNDCHRRDDHKDNFENGCIDCHAPDDFHSGRNGTDCGSCHAAESWPATSFDHAETGFALTEAHADITCSACHKTAVHSPLPTDCGSCHAIDDAHAGQLGDDCGSCHTQTDWLTSVAFDHDLTAFPLTGLHAIAACGSCHQDTRFKSADTECASCHVDDDVHAGTLGDACGECHTSNGWKATVFDHDLHTRFPLDGSHRGLACNDCHRDNEDSVPFSCGGCHRNDDVHDGEFGNDCAACHTTSSFSVIDSLGRMRQ